MSLFVTGGYGFEALPSKDSNTKGVWVFVCANATATSDVLSLRPLYHWPAYTVCNITTVVPASVQTVHSAV